MTGEIGSLLGGIAGLVAAVAFVCVIGVLTRAIVKLGQVFDETRVSIESITEHTIPILDETVVTLASTNGQLDKLDTITTSAAEVSENVSALTALFAATVGGPLIKVASFTYGVRNAMSNFGKKTK